MKLFVLSLEGDSLNWLCDFPPNSYKTLKELQDGFIDKWGECRGNCHLLAALKTIKTNENKTMEEFNKKFNEYVANLHTNIKPPLTAILIHYIEAFSDEIAYQLRD